jgi:hypothetical protein
MIIDAIPIPEPIRHLATINTGIEWADAEVMAPLITNRLETIMIGFLPNLSDNGPARSTAMQAASSPMETMVSRYVSLILGQV